MITNHASKFRRFIYSSDSVGYNKIKYLRNNLRQMCDHKNKDVSSIGFKATDAVMKEVRFKLNYIIIIMINSLFRSWPPYLLRMPEIYQAIMPPYINLIKIYSG